MGLYSGKLGGGNPELVPTSRGARYRKFRIVFLGGVVINAMELAPPELWLTARRDVGDCRLFPENELAEYPGAGLQFLPQASTDALAQIEY